jgi:hypothetical protein
MSEAELLAELLLLGGTFTMADICGPNDRWEATQMCLHKGYIRYKEESKTRFHTSNISMSLFMVTDEGKR